MIRPVRLARRHSEVRPSATLAGAPTEVEAVVESLNYDGRGVARVNGKATFIDGALPGETVRLRYLGRHKSYDTATLSEILTPSPDRVVPRCRHFGACGGCSLQHLRPEAQIAAKQQVLREQLARIGKVGPATWLDPLTGPVWSYRRRARLGVRFVSAKGGVLIGFREKRSSFITPLEECPVLEPDVGALLPAMRALIGGLSCPQRIPQIEVAAGNNAIALVVRHLQALTDADRVLLRQFADGIDDCMDAGGTTPRTEEVERRREQPPRATAATGIPASRGTCASCTPPGAVAEARAAGHGRPDCGFARQRALQIYLQAEGPDSILPLGPEKCAMDGAVTEPRMQTPPPLDYALPAYNVSLRFQPTDFIQVNDALNRKLVHQALTLLDLNPADRVLDLFSGLGNFTLPIARQARRALGVDAETSLLERARGNAGRNDLNNAEFRQADLYNDTVLKDPPWNGFDLNKVLLDPPRAGAIQVLKQLPPTGIERLVYVSCNPATLARDAEYLVHVRGFQLASAGVIDMFPHTGHVESMALFLRP